MTEVRIVCCGRGCHSLNLSEADKAQLGAVHMTPE